MGIPANSFDPTALARASLGATTEGSWLGGIGLGLTSVSDAMAGAYQSRVAENNAALASADAQAAEEAGRTGAETSLLRTGETIGAQRAAIAGNNIDVNSGSARAIQDSTRAIGDYDAAIIRYNAEREAYSRRTEARSYRSQATLGMLSTGFGIARDAGRTYSSFLSGSNALRNSAMAFREAGVPGW